MPLSGAPDWRSSSADVQAAKNSAKTTRSAARVPTVGTLRHSLLLQEGTPGLAAFRGVSQPGGQRLRSWIPLETLLGRGRADPNPLRWSRTRVAATTSGEERVGPRRFDRGQRPDLPQIVALRALPRSGRLNRPLFRRRLAVVVLHRRMLLRSSAVGSRWKHPLPTGSRPLISPRPRSHRRPAARSRRRTDWFQREA